MSSEEVAELRSLVASHLTLYYDTHFNLLRWIQAMIYYKISARFAEIEYKLYNLGISWYVDR